jgi:hypothetical protein
LNKILQSPDRIGQIWIETWYDEKVMLLVISLPKSINVENSSFSHVAINLDTFRKEEIYESLYTPLEVRGNFERIL